jgi:hypothetical protein
MNYDNKCKKKKMVFMHLYNSFYHGLDNFFLTRKDKHVGFVSVFFNIKKKI